MNQGIVAVNPRKRYQPERLFLARKVAAWS